MHLRLSIVVLAALWAGCKHEPPPSTPIQAGPSETKPPAGACPAAKHTTEICAAVMTAIKDPASGSCCMYGSPCEVPIDGPQYSDDKCTAPVMPEPPADCSKAPC